MYQRFRILGVLTLLLGLLASPALAAPEESPEFSPLTWIEAIFAKVFSGPGEEYGTFVEPGGLPTDPDSNHGLFIEPGGAPANKMGPFTDPGGTLDPAPGEVEPPVDPDPNYGPFTDPGG